ncbi:MAG: hypothetical protein ACF8MF_06710 [Phycisphaerales bacterium JB052]
MDIENYFHKLDAAILEQDMQLGTNGEIMVDLDGDARPAVLSLPSWEKDPAPDRPSRNREHPTGYYAKPGYDPLMLFAVYNSEKDETRIVVTDPRRK